jgi:hypothetical protein
MDQDRDDYADPDPAPRPPHSWWTLHVIYPTLFSLAIVGTIAAILAATKAAGDVIVSVKENR